jgi:hypothetical protein
MLFLNSYGYSFCKYTRTLEADVAQVRSLLYTISLLHNWQLKRHYYIPVRHKLQHKRNKKQLHTPLDTYSSRKLDPEVLEIAMANITTVQLMPCYKCTHQVNARGDKTQGKKPWFSAHAAR